MSVRGIPSGFRNMHLFGSHTFSFINANNERFWVKFTFKTQQGIKNLTDAQACELVGKDRESSRSEEHTSELQSLMRISYAVFCLKKKNNTVLKETARTT